MSSTRSSVARMLALKASVVFALALFAAAPSARASGYDLNGRLAPELTFPDGMNGISRSTSLSSYRGRVVYLKFVLRDCPICRGELPRVQDLYERWGGSGLAVVVVVHQYRPAEIQPFLDQFGYSFPIGCDLDGSLAQRYGVGHRPADYLIGVDGRVKASNAVSDAEIRTELAHYRMARIGEVPPELDALKDAVWRWDYGTALRAGEPVAERPEASASVKQVVERTRALAKEELDARVAYADVLVRRGRTEVARTFYERVVDYYKGTSLETPAADARARFLASLGTR